MPNILSITYTILRVPYVSEEEARDALASFVSEHCCYGKGPVKDLKFDYIESSDAYRVRQETSCLLLVLILPKFLIFPSFFSSQVYPPDLYGDSLDSIRYRALCRTADLCDWRSARSLGHCCHAKDSFQ